MSDITDPNTRTAKPKRVVKRRVIAPKDAPTNEPEPQPTKVDKR